MSTIDDLQRLHEAATGEWRKCSANDGKCMCGLVWNINADRVVCSCAADERANADEWDHKNADAIVALHNAWPAIHRLCLAVREFADRRNKQADTFHQWAELWQALRALDDKEQRT